MDKFPASTLVDSGKRAVCGAPIGACFAILLGLVQYLGLREAVILSITACAWAHVRLEAPPRGRCYIDFSWTQNSTISTLSQSDRRLRERGATRMTTAKKIDALLALRSDGKLMVGRDRIRVLEAVAEHGSISKAAKAVGFSYKAAWDAVTAINNLLPSPAFMTKAGGRSGGGAELTPAGRQLIATFHRLEDRLSRISSVIAEEGFDGQEDLALWGLIVKISARNVFQAEVVSIKKWPVDVEVALRISGEHIIHATITNEAVTDLELKPGSKVVALVKSPLIEVGPAEGPPSNAQNRFLGVVTRRVDAERNSELLIDIGLGKTMTAVVPRRDLDAMEITERSRVAAWFDPQNVIIATA